MNADILKGGFTDAPIEAAFAFRQIMNVMAKPGEIRDLSGAVPPVPLSIAAGIVLLTLCDPETPIHLAGEVDCKAVRDWIAFHIGAPVTHKPDAIFAIGSWQALLPLADFPIGTPEYPDRSATLIVECERLAPEGAVLRGPGIKEHSALSLPDTQAFQENASLFPLGLDFFFTAGAQVAALPRTTQVEAN
ncbi:phosphonate C-P lyase system protein PhnH [Shimia sp. SDUM112013]|uniref:phosphonate C-P lyase system protein PhnH n=1 Tax=Shimia sp. SDUM112013 TaxID=3136160 RepID=UPI0032ED540E